MLDFATIRRAEVNYAAFHGGLDVLMEKAGSAVAEEIRKTVRKGSRILFLCGTGNNGGDGITAARLLSGEYETTVIIASGGGKVKTELAANAMEKYHGRIASFEDAEVEVAKTDYIVDALLGTGSKRSLREPVLSAVRMMNGSGKGILSVDVPTGLGTRERVKPSVTVTFTGRKKGMTQGNSGIIRIADIGIPEDCFSDAGPGDFIFYPIPEADSHKGMNGIVSVIAGWESFGAGVMTSLSALRTGVDLVKVYLPKDRMMAFYGYSPELMLNELDSGSIDEINRSHCLLIGPGMGKEGFDREAAENVIRKCGVPMVIDANTLKIIDRSMLKGKKVVVTPHHGEFEIFSGLSATERNARLVARETGCVVLLKGRTDIITDGKTTFHGVGGNARMTMGGTGDMLAGLVAGFVARGMPLLNAASFAAYVNKTAGELAFVEKGYWYSAMDMMEKFPFVINDARMKAHQL